MERRSASELRVGGSRSSPRLEGFAAVWDAPSEGLPFREVIRRGAFTRSLKRNDADVLALIAHDPSRVLGRKGRETERGLAYSIMLPDTQAARDLAVSVERGDVAGASFAFTVAPGGENWTEKDGQMIRSLTDLDLFEVSVVANPAYPSTEVALRSLEHWRASQRQRIALARRFLETV